MSTTKNKSTSPSINTEHRSTPAAQSIQRKATSENGPRAYDLTSSAETDSSTHSHIRNGDRASIHNKSNRATLNGHLTSNNQTQVPIHAVNAHIASHGAKEDDESETLASESFEDEDGDFEAEDRNSTTAQSHFTAADRQRVIREARAATQQEQAPTEPAREIEAPPEAAATDEWNPYGTRAQQDEIVRDEQHQRARKQREAHAQTWHNLGKALIPGGIVGALLGVAVGGFYYLTQDKANQITNFFCDYPHLQHDQTIMYALIELLDYVRVCDVRVFDMVCTVFDRTLAINHAVEALHHNPLHLQEQLDHQRERLQAQNPDKAVTDVIALKESKRGWQLLFDENQELLYSLLESISNTILQYNEYLKRKHRREQLRLLPEDKRHEHLRRQRAMLERHGTSGVEQLDEELEDALGDAATRLKVHRAKQVIKETDPLLQRGIDFVNTLKTNFKEQGLRAFSNADILLNGNLHTLRAKQIVAFYSDVLPTDLYNAASYKELADTLDRYFLAYRDRTLERERTLLDQLQNAAINSSLARRLRYVDDYAEYDHASAFRKLYRQDFNELQVEMAKINRINPYALSAEYDYTELGAAYNNATPAAAM